MRLSVRDELRNHTPHAIPLNLAARCWWLHVCIETPEAPFSLQPRVVPYLHAAEYTRCLSLSLLFSLVRRMIAMLINCVAEKTKAHSVAIISVVFSPDGTKIVSGSIDGTIKVWDFGAPKPRIAPPWPRLMLFGLPGRHTGAVEREDGRPQRLDHVGRVLPGRDQDCVRIVRQDDQSLGYRQLVSQRSLDVQRYHPAICLTDAVAEQMQHEVS